MNKTNATKSTFDEAMRHAAVQRIPKKWLRERAWKLCGKYCFAEEKWKYWMITHKKKICTFFIASSIFRYTIFFLLTFIRDYLTFFVSVVSFLFVHIRLPLFLVLLFFLLRFCRCLVNCCKFHRRCVIILVENLRILKRLYTLFFQTFNTIYIANQNEWR